MGGVCSSGPVDPPTALPRPSNREPTHSLFKSSHDGAVNDVCSGEIPGTFWSCGDDRRVILHGATSGETLLEWSTGHTRAVNRLSFDASTGMLATASRDRTIRLWRRPLPDKSPEPAPAHTLSGHDLTVSAIHFTSDGSRLASGSRDSSVRVWDAETGRSTMRAERSQNLVTCLRWHPAQPQSVIIQGGEDLRVRLWDARTSGLREAQVLEGYTYFPVRLGVNVAGMLAHS